LRFVLCPGAKEHALNSAGDPNEARDSGHSASKAGA
jgi:hypothetical protein